jgi:predicted nucleic acid-binding Zn ribbon protein
MPDHEKDKEKDKDEKKSTLQERLDAIDAIKDLAVKNISSKIMTDDPNNTYTRKPTKMRKIVGLKGFKGFKGSGSKSKTELT